MVRQGQFPNLPAYSGPQRGVFHLDCHPKTIGRALLRVRDELAHAAATSDDILVIEVNNRMQARRQNEGVLGRRRGPLANFVAVSDPVICTRNRYDEALLNGLMGRIANLDPLLINFDGEDEPRQIGPDAILELQSAWAITCHRA
jgi:exodeoxyribonuclease V alpha subunit